MGRTSLFVRYSRVVAAAAAASGSLSACSDGGADRIRVEVFEATIADLQGWMERGEATAVDLVDAYVARIEAYDGAGPELNAIVHLNAGAREVARELDEERTRSGPRGPLHGVPILLKDNFNTTDMPTTAGSIALVGMIPAEDATVVRRLREAGAVILGKTNLHEWAYGYTSISSHGGQTRNPYDPTRNPGGSSGGTGAAIAASLAALGYGTDTCGSVRVPAASNALFGLRPTKGFASVHGIIPLAHTQDTPGPLARTVTDLAIGLQVMAGLDPEDAATDVLRGREPVEFLNSLRGDALVGARFGLLSAYFGEEPEELEVSLKVRAAIDRMREAGAEVVEVEFPGLDSLLSGTSVITQEFRTDLLEYLASVPGSPVASLEDVLTRELFHPAVEGALRASQAAAGPESEGYLRTLERRQAVQEAVLRFLDDLELDAIVYPVVRREPAPIGEGQGGVNCQLSAATGLPALAAPAGLTASGLPVGVELLGRPLDEARLLAFAYAYEQSVQPRISPPLVPPIQRAPER